MKVLSNTDCIKSSNKANKLFHQVPDQMTKFTSCRDMNKMEKEKYVNKIICFGMEQIVLNLLKNQLLLLKKSYYSITLDLKVNDFLMCR